MHLELFDLLTFLLTLALSFGCSYRKESALAGFMFRYLDQIFLIPYSPFPHCGNFAVIIIPTTLFVK